MEEWMKEENYYCTVNISSEIKPNLENKRQYIGIIDDGGRLSKIMATRKMGPSFSSVT